MINPVCRVADLCFELLYNNSSPAGLLNTMDQYNPQGVTRFIDGCYQYIMI